MSTIINNNAITKMYKGDTPIYSFSINSGGDINLTNIDITTNGTYAAPDGEGYKTINVDVPTGGGSGKIDVAANGIKFGNSTFREIPDIFDFSNLTDLIEMFSNSGIVNAQLNCPNGQYFDSMFNNCQNLVNVSIGECKPRSVYGMFRYCPSLTNAPHLNLEECVDTMYMFESSYFVGSINYNMKNVKYVTMMMAGVTMSSLPLLDFSSAYGDNYFIFGGDWQENPNLTTVGGFANLKGSFSNFINMLPNLTNESLMNIINNLWDWTDYPDGRVYNEYWDEWQEFGTEHYLRFGQTNLDKLSAEQIAVATTKGWTLTA